MYWRSSPSAQVNGCNGRTRQLDRLHRNNCSRRPKRTVGRGVKRRRSSARAAKQRCEMIMRITAAGALAQETRLAPFRLLLPAGVIAERLRVPPSLLSFYLAQLVSRAPVAHLFRRILRDERAARPSHRKSPRSRCRLRSGVRPPDVLIPLVWTLAGLCNWGAR